MVGLFRPLGTPSLYTQYGLRSTVTRLSGSSWWPSKAVTGQEISQRVVAGPSVATLGSTATSDTNDPVFLDHDGHNYIWVDDSIAGNYVTVPTVLYPPEETQSQWIFRVVDPGGNGGYYAWQTGRSYATVDASNASMIVTRESDGSSLTLAVALTDAYLKPWVRWTMDWGTDGGTSDLTVHYSDESDVWDIDDVTWVLAGTANSSDVSVPTAGTLGIGAQGATGVMPTCGFHTVKITHNDGADVQVDLNMDRDVDTSSDPDAGQATITDNTGRSLTVVRSATGLKTAVVTRSTLLFDGTDDYVQLPDADIPSYTATSGKFTVVLHMRKHGTWTGWVRPLSFESSDGDGLYFYGTSGAAGLTVATGGSVTSNTRALGDVVSGTALVVAGVVDDGTLVGYRDTTGSTASISITGIGTPTFTNGLWGCRGDNALYTDIEYFDVLVFDGVALTEAQLDDVSTYLTTGSGADGLATIQNQGSAYYKAGRAVDTATITSAILNASSSAEIGSTSGSDTNDPTFLDHDGEHYMRIFTGANNARTPNPSAGATGDLTVVARFSKDTDAGGQYPLGMYNGGTTGRWGCYWDTGNVGVYGKDNSDVAFSLNTSHASFTNVSFDGTGEYWFKLTRVSGVWTAYLEPGGSSTEPTFTTPVLLSSGASDGGDVLNTTPNIDFGSAAGTSPGVYYYCRIEQAAGTVTFDPANDIDTTSDPDAGQASWTASTGETWTISRASSGLKTVVVTRPVLLFDGTDDYVQLPAADTPSFTATSGKYTAVVAGRCHHQQNSDFGDLLTGVSGTNDGFYLAIRGGAVQPYPHVYIGSSGGTANNSYPGGTFGEMWVVAMVVDDGNFTPYNDDNGLDPTSVAIEVGTITHGTVRVGMAEAGIMRPYTGEVFDVLIFDGVALTEAQLDELSARLLAGHYT